MIDVTPLAAAIFIQILLIFVFFCIGLFFYIRKLSARLKSAVEKKPAEESDNTSTVEHYLATEIKLTKGRKDALYSEDQEPVPQLTEPDWLALRECYLEFEKELFFDKEREDAFWVRLGDGLKKLLVDSSLVKRSSISEAKDEDDEDTHEMKKLMRSQTDELESFLRVIEDDDSAISSEELVEKLRHVANSHRELSHCMFVLEDENNFLREQITALLK